MFTPLGLLVGLYTTYAACTGSVYARRGAWGSMIARDEEPIRFWVTIACYALLALAMIVIF
jgi:hypothetical protein